MPSKTFVIPLLVLLSLQVQAQFPAPAPAPAPVVAAPEPMPALGCTNALLNLSLCLTYVTAGSNLTRPDKGCCGALAGVVAGEAVCLCQLVAGYGAYGVKVDTVRALTLPTICRVDVPPASLCAALGVPVGSLPPPSGTVPAQSGSGTPATTTTTTIMNGGPATYKNPRHLRLMTLSYCTMLFSLLF